MGQRGYLLHIKLLKTNSLGVPDEIMRWGRVTPEGLSSALSITPYIRPFKKIEIFRIDSLKSPIHFLNRVGSHRHPV
jgi:hypothetical protein